MIDNILILVAGFAALIKGAGWLVEGATNMARRLGVSTLVLGLTVVAFGTSLPELAISVLAAVEGSSKIALGNVIGSNFANIGLILGISAIIAPIIVRSSTIWKEIPFALAAAVIMLLLTFDTKVAEGTQDLLTSRDGLILLIFFVMFLFYIFSVGLSERRSFFYWDEEFKVETEATHMKWPAIIALILIGVVMVFGGGELVVRSSMALSLVWGLSESFIGITIIAVGTSLPELVTSLVAAYKGQSDIAVGNIVGSNIFNSLFILGVASLIHPLEIDSHLWIDGIYMVGLTVLLWIFSGYRSRLGRYEGVILLVSYIAYICYVVWRQGVLHL